jgi:hypothetical protein
MNRDGEFAMTKKPIVVAGSLVVICLSVCVLTTLFNPARKSDAAIREELLIATPLGSSETQVKQYAQRRFGEVRGGRVPGAEGKVLSVTYGTYLPLDDLPWPAVVNASWYFDKEGKLERVGASRYSDSP